MCAGAYPELARKFVDATLEQVRTGKAPNLGQDVVRSLAGLAPDEAIATLPEAAPSTLPYLIGALARTNHLDSALYRSSFSHGKVRVTAVSPLIAQLAKERRHEAAALFQESVAAFSFDDLEPWDAWWLITTERDTVAGFLRKQDFTFPILLDPGRKVHTAFAVEGIPKSFLFDREGNLVSQAIDMRTERQFLEMLKKAGLE